MKRCFSCKREIEAVRPGRRDVCDFCGVDLKVCLNCSFYDAAMPDGCREPASERIMDKDRANFCDFFSFREDSQGEGPGGVGGAGEDPMEKLRSLFKKG